ncbi:MAG: hypothetical protein IKF38_07060 [Clostridia bacterium]|nr:hypothetical protein [Clostridia bacterium]
MEEKKVTKISLSIFLLILAIIIIAIMGVFIFKLNNEKTIETQKATELQAQVNNLNGTVSNLQEKINTISATINTEIPAQTTTSNSSTQKEVSTNTSTNTNSDDTKYEISIRDEIYATIKATKNGKTVTKEFEMGGTIAETGTMTLPTIGTVALVADTGGEYYGVNVYQLVNGKMEKLGTIDCGADMVSEATYEVTTKGETTAVITAKRNSENIKKEFEMDAAIAKTEVVDVLKRGKVVLVAETGGEHYAFKVFRLSQDYTNGKTKGIVEAGTINYLF